MNLRPWSATAHEQAAETLVRPHDLPFRFRDGLAAQELVSAS